MLNVGGVLTLCQSLKLLRSCIQTNTNTSTYSVGPTRIHQATAQITEVQWLNCAKGIFCCIEWKVLFLECGGVRERESASVLVCLTATVGWAMTMWLFDCVEKSSSSNTH